MYLVSGYTYGERIIHRPDLRPDLGRWLQKKHTPRFRASAVNGIIWRRELRRKVSSASRYTIGTELFIPSSQIATVVYRKNIAKERCFTASFERGHHFDDPRNPKVVKSDLRNNDELVIHHPRRTERSR